MSLLAETSALTCDADSAAVLYPLLLPWACFNVADYAEAIRGAVSRYLGLLATTLGRSDEADAHFRHALAMNEQLGLRPWLAYTQDDYARMLLARGRADDRPRARQLLDQALATCHELGITPSGALSRPNPSASEGKSSL
jgi:tetratricopeptide (TPR) repeat protein